MSSCLLKCGVESGICLLSSSKFPLTYFYGIEQVFCVPELGSSLIRIQIEDVQTNLRLESFMSCSFTLLTFMELLPNYTNLSGETLKSKISSSAERDAVLFFQPQFCPSWIVHSVSEHVSHSVSSQIAKGWNALATWLQGWNHMVKWQVILWEGPLALFSLPHVV